LKIALVSTELGISDSKIKQNQQTYRNITPAGKNLAPELLFSLTTFSCLAS